MNNNYLMHYGVKGMKWGVRHDRPSSAERKARRKRRLSIARNYTGGRGSDALRVARRQDINTMSNQELQLHVNRLNLERQYRSLTAVDINRGQNYMKTANKYDASIKAIYNKSGNTARKIAKGAAWASTTGGAGVVGWG